MSIMPDKGDTEITIPTFKQMSFMTDGDESRIIIESETGTITIKCFKSVKGKFDEDKD